MTIITSNAFDVRVAAPLWDSIAGGSLANGWTATRTVAGECATTLISDGTIGSCHQMDYIDEGQNYFGGYYIGNGTAADTQDGVRAAIANAQQLNVRYLVRFGDTNGSDEWNFNPALHPIFGESYSYELKAFDINNGDTAQRFICLLQSGWNFTLGDDYDRGTLALRIDGTSGETQTYFPVDGDGWSWAIGASNQWWYVEFQVNNDGSIYWWRAPYDGTGTEYLESTPTRTSTSAHTYNFDWIRTAGFDFGFRNHWSVDGTNTVYARMSISNSFIGPL